MYVAFTISIQVLSKESPHSSKGGFVCHTFGATVLTAVLAHSTHKQVMMYQS